MQPNQRVMMLAPSCAAAKASIRRNWRSSGGGLRRARIDGELRSLDEDIRLDKRKNHTIEVVVDRLQLKPGIEKRLKLPSDRDQAGGRAGVVAVVDGEERMYSQKLACPECGASVPQLEPRSFSFNSPYGACEACTGSAANGRSTR